MKKTVSIFLINQSAKIFKGLGGFLFLIMSVFAVRNSAKYVNFQNSQLISRIPASVDCSIFKNWKAHRSQLVNISTPKLKSEAIESEYRESIELSQLLYQKYLNHEYNPNLNEQCLTSKDRLEFTQTLNSVFRNETMDRLVQSSSSRIQLLIDKIGRNDFLQHRVFFRVTGHLNEKSPTELIAGFNRSGKNIYIDISKVNPDDWTMIFIHELAHLSDTKLSQASETFAKKEWVEEFYSWSQKTSDFQKLPQDVQTRLRLWIMSGLDRGLLFEYRAWLETILIYNEMIRLNEIPRSAFIEYGLSQIDSRKKLSNGLFEFLDRNSSNPQEGIFTVPLIMNALESIREELRRTPPSD